jgi:TatD DNase family protein
LCLRIFESHCHLDDRGYADDLEGVLQRARSADVRALMVVGTDGPSSRRAVEIADHYPHVFAAVGLHPHDASACSEELLDDLRSLARHDKVRAWGEIGLDFNRMRSPRPMQEQAFIRQLEIAQALALPMIFHERDSQGRFLQIIRCRWGSHGKGVVHCFSGNEAELEAYLELGLSIGITGILTHKDRGAALRRMVPRIPDQRLLLETDAPYLTPSPERNKFRRNEPAFLRTILLKLAQVRGQEPMELAAALWSNTCSLFGLPEDFCAGH